MSDVNKEECRTRKCFWWRLSAEKNQRQVHTHSHSTFYIFYRYFRFTQITIHWWQIRSSSRRSDSTHITFRLKHAVCPFSYYTLNFLALSLPLGGQYKHHYCYMFPSIEPLLLFFFLFLLHLRCTRKRNHRTLDRKWVCSARK